MRRDGGWIALAAVLVVSCARSLPGPVVSSHPAINLDVPRPVVVETSAVPPPVWVKRPQSGANGHVVFVGNGAAATLADARDKARRDLLTSLARFVSVKVEATFENISSHRSLEGGDTIEEEVSHEEKKSNTDTSADSFREVTLSGEYWEKVAEPQSKSASYRCYLRADVSNETLARARVEKQIGRAKSRGAKIVAFAELEGDGDEILRRVADVPGIFAAPLSAVSDPDFVVRAKISKSASTAEYELTRGSQLIARRKFGGGGSADVFALEEILVDALRRDLTEAGK